jgi:hypothetical protein
MNIPARESGSTCQTLSRVAIVSFETAELALSSYTTAAAAAFERRAWTSSARLKRRGDFARHRAVRCCTAAS